MLCYDEFGPMELKAHPRDRVVPDKEATVMTRVMKSVRRGSADTCPGGTGSTQ